MKIILVMPDALLMDVPDNFESSEAEYQYSLVQAKANDGALALGFVDFLKLSYGAKPNDTIEYVGSKSE